MHRSNHGDPRQFATCENPRRHHKLNLGEKRKSTPPSAFTGRFREHGSMSKVGVVVSLADEGRDTASVKPLMELTSGDMARVNEMILSQGGFQRRVDP